MDVQAAPPTYTAAGTGRPPVGNPPVLGQQVPGMTGGLPAQGGLSVTRNPMAQELQSYGRGDDSMLVHMTPNEVNSLQGLAMAHGGSLTINPHTGLPEAGWLGKLLPTILGVAGAAFGLPTWAIGLGVGAGQTAITGDLGKGLMAGLSAFGGAGLGQAAGLGGKISSNAMGLMGNTASQASKVAAPLVAGQAQVADLGATAAQNIAKMNAGLGLSSAPSITAPALSAGVPSAAFQNAFAGMATPAVPTIAAAPGAMVGDMAAQAATKAPGFLGRFTQATTIPGLGKIGPMAAGMGLLNSVSGSTGGVRDQQTGAIDNSYQGPYRAQERVASFAPSTEDLLGSSKERTYFDVSQPEIYNMRGQVVQPGSDTAPGTQIWQPVLNPKAKKGQDMYAFQPRAWMSGQTMAKGGAVHMDEGSFVMPARETAEFGKGSTQAGQEVLSRLGGMPIRGRGDGVSDDIPASIGGQKARVADGEVHFPAEAVKRIGKGSHKKGTEKLYALMKKAEQSRKRAARGGKGLDLLRNMA